MDLLKVSLKFLVISSIKPVVFSLFSQ